VLHSKNTRASRNQTNAFISPTVVLIAKRVVARDHDGTRAVIRALKAVGRRVLGTGLISEPTIAQQVLASSHGVMLDVGAHNGMSLESFASKPGWEIHAFEPDVANCSELRATYGGYRNVHIVPKGVSATPGPLTLYTSPESTGVSSFAPFTPLHRPTATVDVVTLATYMADHSITNVDFLKIDVEGFEREVLAGYDWSIEPRCVVMEFEDAKTVPRGYRWTDLAETLLRHDYDVRVSEWFPLTHYGGGHQWRRFAKYPTSLADPEGWGNLLAFKDVNPFTITRALGRATAGNRVWSAARRLGIIP
jgi:FkbM family methyltransferase